MSIYDIDGTGGVGPDVVQWAKGNAEMGKHLQPRTDLPWDQLLQSTHLSFDEVKTAKPPVCVVDSLLYAEDAYLLVAESGVGKSTLSIYLAVLYILGRDWFGRYGVHHLTRDPVVLFVSSEERRSHFTYVLHRIMLGMGLTADEQNRVVTAMRFLDCSEDASAQFTSYDPNEHRRKPSGWASTFEATLHALRPQIVFVDPLGMFMGGAENSNDDAMPAMKEIRRIARWTCCAVVLIHHSGKGVAREKVSDQHAGRGASAINSNTRGMWHMLRTDSGTVKINGQDWVVPEGVAATDLAAGNVTVLAVHKGTYAPPGLRPVCLVRDGWAFRVSDMVTAGGGTDGGPRANPDAPVMAAWLRAQASPEHPVSKRTAREARAEHGLSQSRATAAFEFLERAGALVLLTRGKNSFCTGVVDDDF